MGNFKGRGGGLLEPLDNVAAKKLGYGDRIKWLKANDTYGFMATEAEKAIIKGEVPCVKVDARLSKEEVIGVEEVTPIEVKATVAKKTRKRKKKE